MLHIGARIWRERQDKTARFLPSVRPQEKTCVKKKAATRVHPIGSASTQNLYYCTAPLHEHLSARGGWGKQLPNKKKRGCNSNTLVADIVVRSISATPQLCGVGGVKHCQTKKRGCNSNTLVAVIVVRSISTTVAYHKNYAVLVRREVHLYVLYFFRGKRDRRTCADRLTNTPHTEGYNR